MVRVQTARPKFKTKGVLMPKLIQPKSGQDLLWPGEFLFGYPAQDPKAEKLEQSKGAVKKSG
jgi:hypothetical protein